MMKLHAGPKPVVRSTMSSMVTEQVRDAILSGAYPPGMQLNEKLVAESCGVSRGPVREAIQRLLQEGLLISVPHRGVFVPELTEDDLEDIYFTRDAVERAALRRIVHSDGRQELSARLLQIADAMKVAVEQEDWAEVAAVDIRFHSELVNAAGSQRLSRLFATLMAEMGLCLNQLLGVYRGRERLIEEHVRVAKLIASGDADRLEEAIADHLQEPVETIRNAWEKARQDTGKMAFTGSENR
ncbi:GntR family transcriptional regulator [Halomonas ramblicola]|uniref:GntR family transcriptional regulator n=1 Tax=Halomonas ramblicola TaxID=747349 RepID=UPI0025B3A78F|nr:GntR family transcriptional regulator [Halomonas ramblicola]MDN3519994.1 GntR family transcriptional regulator [Halomonas ramblicola]